MRLSGARYQEFRKPRGVHRLLGFCCFYHASDYRPGRKMVGGLSPEFAVGLRRPRRTRRLGELRSPLTITHAPAD